MNVKKTLVTALLIALLAISALFKPSMNEAATPEQIDTFISGIAPYAVDTAAENPGLYPSIMIAQACLETGYGRHVPQNNIFGIKSLSNKPKQQLNTTEVIDGNRVSVTDQFAVFEDYADAFQSYARLLMNAPVYQNVRTAGSPEAAAHALTGTYATDPKYARSLLWIINAFDLRRFDTQAAQTVHSNKQEAAATPTTDEKTTVDDVVALPLSHSQETAEPVIEESKEVSAPETVKEKGVPPVQKETKRVEEIQTMKENTAVTSTPEATPEEVNDTLNPADTTSENITNTESPSNDTAVAEETKTPEDKPVAHPSDAVKTDDNKTEADTEQKKESDKKNEADKKDEAQHRTVAKNTTVLAEYEKPTQSNDRPLIKLPDNKKNTPIVQKTTNIEKESSVNLSGNRHEVEAPFAPEQVPKSIPVLPILIFVTFTVCLAVFGIKKLN